MRPLFTLLLLCATASAQPGPIPLRSVDAWANAAPDFNALLPTGMKFRYKSSDLSSSPVSDWVDEISSYHWTASGSARPSLDTNAVIFNGTANSLTATNGTIFQSDSATLLVYQYISTAADQPIFTDDGFSGGQINFAIGDTADFLTESSVGNNAVGHVGTALQDFITVRTNATNYRAYTNGVDGAWGNTNPWNGTSSGMKHVGSGNGNFFAHVILKEWIYWTNVGSWSATTISNVHCYATNAYPHTP